MFTHLFNLHYNIQIKVMLCLIKQMVQLLYQWIAKFTIEPLDFYFRKVAYINRFHRSI